MCFNWKKKYNISEIADGIANGIIIKHNICPLIIVVFMNLQNAVKY